MASVYLRHLRHGSVWNARVRTLEGEWISVPLGLEGEPRSVAIRAAAEVQRKIDRGEEILEIRERRRRRQPETDLKSLTHRYLEERARHWSAKSAISAELSLRKALAALGNVSVPAITAATVQKLLNSYEQQRLSPHSINLYLRNFRAFLNWCEELHIKGWKAPKIKEIRAVNKERDYYTREECQRLLAAARPLTIGNQSIAPFLAFLLLTGMRYSEALACDWSWVDLRRDRIQIPAARTKSNRSRIVPISPALKQLLQALPDPHRGLLWPFSPYSGHLQHRYRQAVRGAGIRYLRLHNLRDTYAVNMLLAGVPLVVVSRILGHASITTTVKNYAAIADEELAVAAEKGEKFMEGLLPTS